MNERQRPVLGAVVGVLVGCLVVAVLLLLVRTWSLADTIRGAQTANTSTLNASTRTLDAVESCTTPGRPCYERGQKQTASAVGDINRVVILAAACADRPREQTVTEIQQCVIQRLAAAHHR